MADPRSPKSPRKGKVISLRVNFLNDTVHAFQVPVKAVGLLLWDAVVSHLQLLESDYFGLEYTNHYEDESWLDNNKQILKQLPSADTPLRFGVKFYMPDPSMLEEEITRYFFALQVRRDLLLGELHCSENTAALLASYIVQGEIGDFLVDEYRDISYLSSFKFVPQRQQTVEMLQKVMEYHRQHVGESPSEADSNLLDTARKVEMYGIKFHPAKDHEGVSLNLAVAHMGVLVFQGMTKINTFSWAKVRKLSFKRKKFLIKLHPESYGYYKDTVEFFFDTRDRCKYFWKKCIEHHSFFRCQTIKKMPRNKTRVVSRGSSFRYSGRTQKELQEYVRENIVKRPIIERSVSGRISSRSTSVTPKISAKPSVHNSSDLHNSTASSGSHILETSSSGLPPIPPTRLETAEIHSDSSMSGSRSLGSPRLEHGLSADSEGGEFINQPVDTAAVDARLPHSDSPGADSDFDKFDDIPLSLSDSQPTLDSVYVDQKPDFSDSRFCHQVAAICDEDVNDADVDDDDDDDNRVHRLSNNKLSANQNANNIKVSEHIEPSNAENRMAGSEDVCGSRVEELAVITDSSNQTGVVSPTGVRNMEEVMRNIEKKGKIVTNGSVIIDVPCTDRTGVTAQVCSSSSSDVIVGQQMPLPSPPPPPQPSSEVASAICNSNPSVSVTQAEVHTVQRSEVSGLREAQKSSDLETTLSNTTGTVSHVGSAPAIQTRTPVVVNADLIEDIPYVLHRRSYIAAADEKKEEAAVSPAADGPSTRRSRSKSPRVRMLQEEGVGGESAQRAYKDRSPSLTRRFELVHYNKLPARDSYSSVDDTTSPSSELDILKQMEMKSPQSGSEQPVEASWEKVGVDVNECIRTGRQISASDDVCISQQPVVESFDGDKKMVNIKVERDSKEEMDVLPLLPPQPPIHIPPQTPPHMPPPPPVPMPPQTQHHIPPQTHHMSPQTPPHMPPPPPVPIPPQTQHMSPQTPRHMPPPPPVPMPPQTQHHIPPQTHPMSPQPPPYMPPSRPLMAPPPPPPPIVPQTPPRMPQPPPRPPNPTAEAEPPPMTPILTTISTNTVTVTKPLVSPKPQKPPVMPKTFRKPPVAPKTMSSLKRDTSPGTVTSVTSLNAQLPLPPPPLVTAVGVTMDQEDFPPPPCDLLLPPPLGDSDVGGIEESDLDAFPPPPSELLMELSPQSSFIMSSECPATMPSPPPDTIVASLGSCQSAGQCQWQEDQSTKCNSAPNTCTAFKVPATAINPSTTSHRKEEMKDQHIKPGSNDQPKPTLPDDNDSQLPFDSHSAAAALIYSDTESPPCQAEPVLSVLTFSTFRPDQSEAETAITMLSTVTAVMGVPTTLVTDDSGNSCKDPHKRWSLERVEEEPSAEGGGQKEKIAAKAEPKRVSWHEDTESTHSFHSDVSMTVMPSPLDEGPSSSLGGSSHPDDIDSGDILETLENLRHQGSESDITYSGSSGSSSDEGDVVDHGTAKEVYLQYAASKCLAETGKFNTIDSGMGEMSEGTMTTNASHNRDTSPLDTLERLESLEGSFVSDVGKSSVIVEDFPPPPLFLQCAGSSNSSLSSGEMTAGAVVITGEKRPSVDPLLSLEGQDFADITYTTSESESDFDEATYLPKRQHQVPEVAFGDGVGGGTAPPASTAKRNSDFQNQ